MSKLDFHGQGAGLGKHEGGDANDPASYVLTCGCGTELGPLGRFTVNAESKLRTAWCPTCQHATLIDEGGQVVKFFPVSLESLGRMTHVPTRAP